VLYYTVGMMLAHQVNDDVDYQIPAEYQSRAAAAPFPWRRR
jgi:hypothetical protein